MRVLAATALATVVLLWNVHHGLERTAPRLAEFPARYFADLSIATHLYLDDEFPIASYGVRRGPSRPRRDEAFDTYLQDLERGTGEGGITHARPFAILSATPGTGQRVFVRRRDDSGRAFLLGHAFRALGGTAPYLLFWMATLLAVPVLWWIAFETAAAGCPLAGQTVIALVALSAYATDMLGLAYSAAAFYLVAVLALIAHAVYGCRTRGTSPRGLVLRTAAAGAILAVCALCRSGSLFLVPFFMVSVFIGARLGLGAAAGERALGLWVAGAAGIRREIALPRWSAVLVVAGVVLVGPFLILRSVATGKASRTAEAYGISAEAQEHDIWLSVWEGLGDFDRTRGHFWRDEDARAAAGDRALGTPGSEGIFRGEVLTSIREDPLWYGGILFKRALATLCQWKLLPWHPLGGRSMLPSKAPNEGVVDVYYGLTSNLDWFRIGPRLFEVPLPLFWIAVAGAFLLPFRRPAGKSPVRMALAVVLAATLALPVAITTAGGLETQAVAVAYFLALGIVAEHCARVIRHRS